MKQAKKTEAARRTELRKRIVEEDGLEVFQELRQGKDLTDTVFLLELLIHPNFVVREEALQTLAHRGGTLARIAARSALTDPNVGVRDEAATILGYVGNRRDVPWLLLALDDPDWCVRCSAAGSLGLLGGPTARRCLVEALTGDPCSDVRR
jgi:HEAT repeat protein